MAAIIDPKETYLEIRTTSVKTPTAISISRVINVNSIPSAVAIPFPPLNPANTVQMCQITADIPAII